MKIVTCVPRERGERIALPGCRNHCFTFATNQIKIHEQIDPERAQHGLDTMFCEDADVDHVVAYLSTYHPTVDVIVYDAVSAHVRTPGPLVTKTITKDGILPV